MPEVSVVMPFYNRVDWLLEAVRSVLNQSFSDFEIILVDDGSTTSASSCLEMNDERIRYVRQENRGRSAARNLGIGMSGGAYVAFLDSDDVFLPRKLEKQVASMKTHGDVLFSHTSYKRMDRDGRPVDEVRSGRFAGLVYPGIAVRCPIATPTVMVRREALGNDVRFNEGVKVGEDVILWAQLAKVSPLLGLDEPLTRVRMHGANAASDPALFRQGLTNIMDHVVRGDRDFGFAVRSDLLASLYVGVAYTYLVERRFDLSLWFYLRAILRWPPNRRVRLAPGLVLRSIVRPSGSGLEGLIENIREPGSPAFHETLLSGGSRRAR